MTHRIVRALALGAFAALVSTAALATNHTTCSRASRFPAAGAANRQAPQLGRGRVTEVASAKERRQRGPRNSWQAVA